MVIDNIALSNAQILIPVKDFTETIKNIFEDVLRSQHLIIANISQESVLDNGLITRKEACALLGISLPTLSKHVATGKLPFCRIGKKILFEKSSLMVALQCKGGKNG